MVRAGPGSAIILRMELRPYRTLEWAPWRRMILLVVGGVTHDAPPSRPLKDKHAFRQLTY